jgi:hypothetical protein
MAFSLFKVRHDKFKILIICFLLLQHLLIIIKKIVRFQLYHQLIKIADKENCQVPAISPVDKDS